MDEMAMINIQEWSAKVRALCPELRIGRIKHDAGRALIKINSPRRVVMPDEISPDDAAKYLKWRAARQ